MTDKKMVGGVFIIHFLTVGFWLIVGTAACALVYIIHSLAWQQVLILAIILTLVGVMIHIGLCRRDKRVSCGWKKPKQKGLSKCGQIPKGIAPSMDE